ncbi:FAD-dependent oxidoreductase [Kribbella sancticallisti]|uniref:FAD-dependent oxidoreductase n=1 Tax=Kribbella sancticallisti TaxID=460087 RepID=A0ABP4NHL3_9ACTN
MRVVVVGGGVIGLACAYELLRRGEEVTILEAHTAGSGASFGNLGWMVPAQMRPVPAPGMVAQALRWMLRPDSPLYIRPSLSPGFIRFMYGMWRHCNEKSFRAGLLAHLLLAEGSMQLLDDYKQDGIDFEMHAQGLLQVFASAKQFDNHVAGLDLLRGHGFRPQLLDGTELTRVEPALRSGLRGGIFFPDERHVRPDSLADGLARRCLALGGKLIEGAAVQRVHDRAGRVVEVETDDGRYSADVFLLAAGVWSGSLSRKFGAGLPIRPGKGYSLDYTESPLALRSLVKLMEPQVALSPFDGWLRLAGTMEFAGLDLKVNERRVRAITKAPVEYLNDWNPSSPAQSVWAGARPMTPDGLPVMGRLAALQNCYVAAGHGMLGLTLGPATGSVMAEAMTEGHVPAVLEPFSPRRFGA